MAFYHDLLKGKCLYTLMNLCLIKKIFTLCVFNILNLFFILVENFFSATHSRQVIPLERKHSVYAIFEFSPSRVIASPPL